jgi:hypothetical protein
VNPRVPLLALGLCAACSERPQPVEVAGHLARMDADGDGVLDRGELTIHDLDADLVVRCGVGPGSRRLDAAGLLCVARAQDPNEILKPDPRLLPCRDSIHGQAPTREQRELLSLLRFLAGELPEDNPFRPSPREIVSAASSADPASPPAQALFVRMRDGFAERSRPFPDALISTSSEP